MNIIIIKTLPYKNIVAPLDPTSIPVPITFLSHDHSTGNDFKT